MPSDKKVEIVVGFACNNRCKFCSVGDRTFNKSTDQILREIDAATRYDPYEINFTGGEPTIRRDIFQIVSYAADLVDNVRVTTNGRMMAYKQFTEKLVDAGLTGAIFSLHGADAATHDYLTSVPGSFEQLLNGIRNLRDLGGRISINSVITSRNYQQLPDIVSGTVSKFDVTTYCLIYPTVEGYMRKNLDLLPRYEDVVPFVVRALDIARDHGASAWIFNIPPCFLPKGEAEYVASLDYRTLMIWDEGLITDLDERKWAFGAPFDRCNSCPFRDRCPGVPKEYFDKYLQHFPG